MFKPLSWRLLWLYCACLATQLQARVVRVEIATRTELLSGRSFGEAGPYERITGRVFFSVKAADRHNTPIVDLQRAANLTNGAVTFSADFIVFQPKQPAKGNGTMLLEVPNRGRSRIVSLVDGGDWNVEHDGGDGWFMRHGYTVAALGWQWDAAGKDVLGLAVPIAKENGGTITGLLRGDFTLSHPAADVPLGHLISGTIGGSEYPVSKPDDARNTLTVRDARDAPRTIIPRARWRFASDRRHIHLDGGFQPGKIYEYVYVVADPAVAGLGFAAVRDFAAYAKHDDRAVTPAARVLGEGISQNGRFLRDFLYQGFNADEAGGRALDGVLAHVAGAGRGSFNYRFAQPSRDAQPTSSVFFPTDIFPFTDTPEKDTVTNAEGSLLARAQRDHVTPKIFFSNTSYEYWGRVASLTHTSPDGTRDMPPSENVRIYHLTGLQHFSGPFPPAKGTGDLDGQEPQSPLPVRYFWRAMITNMDAWVRNDTPPPASSYPKISDGTLVPLAGYHFPALPGVVIPHEASQAYRLDFGPDWQQTGILTRQPPAVGEAFPVLVPQVDDDGNERDGVRLPEVAVPLATYTGWNLRDRTIGAADQRVSFEGSYLPFPKTAATRAAMHDPRHAVTERYRDRADYLEQFSRAVDKLVEARWILPEDRASLLARAGAEWDQVTR